MRTNCVVKHWLKRTGSDGYGQPQHTLQAGSWPAACEPLSKRLKVDGRDVLSSMRVSIRSADPPAIAVGDELSVDPPNVVLRVLEATAFPHPVLGGLVLVLG